MVVLPGSVSFYPGLAGRVRAYEVILTVRFRRARTAEEVGKEEGERERGCGRKVWGF